jgi:hypothetical protein
MSHLLLAVFAATALLAAPFAVQLAPAALPFFRPLDAPGDFRGLNSSRRMALY